MNKSKDMNTAQAFSHFVADVYPTIKPKSGALRNAVNEFKKGGNLTINKMEEILTENGYTLLRQPVWGPPNFLDNYIPCGDCSKSEAPCRSPFCKHPKVLK